MKFINKVYDDAVVEIMLLSRQSISYDIIASVLVKVINESRRETEIITSFTFPRVEGS